MYAGHFAAALVIKARVPRTPMWALCVGVGFVDLVFCVLVLAKVEHLTVTPGIAPGFRLDDISFSHSLVACIVWSAVFAGAFYKRGKEVMAALAVAAFSHFPLDFVMHPGDLTYYPGSTARLGLGVWSKLPLGWWFVELAFVVCGCAYYFVTIRGEKRSSARVALVCAAVLFLHVTNSPWLSPVR